VYVLEGSICGLPNLERRVGADRAAAMVDDYLGVAKNVGFKHDAHLHRIDEAGLTFVVGLPMAAEDDASRAIRLALAQLGLDVVADAVEPELRLAVGIQSGMATLKRDAGKLAYDLSPATTAIARRLSREAQGAEVLVGGRVFRVAKGDFTFEELTTIDVPADPDTQPGAPEEAARARVYRLRGPKERAERLRERARGQLRLLGRELELKTLRDIYRDVLVSRRKRQVLIAGDIGMGKRSLVQAFLEGVPAGEAVIIRAAARVSTAFTPYSVLIDLARDLLGLADGASPAEVTRRVERAAALLYATEQDAREVRGLIQMVCMLLGGQLPEGGENIDPAERRQRLLEAMRKVESRLVVDKPLIVIGEDMHWADDETQDLFRELLKVPTPRPILGLVTARPEARVLDAARDTIADVIRLEELGEQERLAMVVREFVPGEDVEPLARDIVERAGGNPFFIREVLDSLVERGIVVREPDPSTGSGGDPAMDSGPGLLRWVRRDAPVQVPTSVEALLAARMDRLPPAEKETLLRAAVLGRVASIAQLDALLGRAAAADLEALEGRGLVR
ncbi:MAG TPA: AAA family ATPase, partial [Planctomycetota bacterium]|nr:AAA family ATPase [Planctomycetota bacterium]